MTVYTPDAFPFEWSGTQNNLGNAYSNRIQGEQKDNLERAIEAFQAALTVRTRDAFPFEWAQTQNGLGNAYLDCIQGERKDNLERAITAYQAALTVYVPAAFPVQWATTQNGLGNAYFNRIEGERRDNRERAIAAYQAALTVRTRDAFPFDWAMTQNNLGNAYLYRIQGERKDNLERAIAAYQAALTVYTPDAFPFDWSMTQNNLGLAYNDRIEGDRKDNLEQAIAAFQSALTVYTSDAFPVDWSTTQNGLGAAYLYRIQGERKDNLEQAIAAYQAALTVRTRDAFPFEWAQTQNNLGAVYSDQGDSDQAIASYQEALKVFHPETLPNDCRQTARLLGNIYAQEKRWTEATKPYQTALEALEILYEQCLTLAGKQYELTATEDLFHCTAYALTRTGKLELALVTLERGRARNLRETLARDRANLERVKELAPEVYQNYQEAANALRNLEAQERIRNTLDKERLTPEANREEIIKTRQQLTNTLQQIRQLEGYKNFLTLPTFEDISGTLQPDKPLIYLTTTEYGSIALILHRSTTEDTITPLQIDSLTDAQLREWLFSTEKSWFAAYFNRRNDRQNWLDVMDNITQELWSKLMGPIINHLQQQGIKQAILIPTGFLGLLPLHAAWTEDTTQPCQRRYALDEICFTYAPNAVSLHNARTIANRTSPDALLAVDNPTKNLSHSEAEIKAAIETFPNHHILPQATQSALKNALSNYSVLHFSCHGYADFTEPLNSGLVMANSEILSLRDLFDLSLTGIRLAVLSACETALPGLETVDEVISLPIGMLQAGVAGIAASLWSVNEISTMILMTRFYNFWRQEKLEPPAALREAQKWVRDTTNGEKLAYFRQLNSASVVNELMFEEESDRTFSHPYHWAAFSYTGV